MRWKTAAPLFIVLVLAMSAGAADLDARRDKRQERIETLTMWKMMEALDLDKATADKVFAIRRKYLRKRSELREAVNRDFERLKHLLRESSQVPSDDDLRSLVNGIHENRKKLRELWEKQYVEVSKVLTVRQQAELVLFLKHFRKELLQMLGRDRPAGLRPLPGGQGRAPDAQQGTFSPGMHPPPPPPPPPSYRNQPPRRPGDQPWRDPGGAPDEPPDEH